MKYSRLALGRKPRRYESCGNRVARVGGDRRFCRIVLLCAPIAAALCADVWRAALDNLWRADQCDAGHRRQRTGVFRGCMDRATQGTLASRLIVGLLAAVMREYRLAGWRTRNSRQISA